ncbi:hypothetical protein [Spirochaeta cellobiosiphila]|uniref:hypothetical protein n=1 Tax=Spirochaeta cellobiosiphila TaxID=504483 RepID=UPI000407FA4C|nr:hypothetical protein [Spirochaeta cellobiosiphila]
MTNIEEAIKNLNSQILSPDNINYRKVKVIGDIKNLPAFEEFLSEFEGSKNYSLIFMQDDDS